MGSFLKGRVRYKRRLMRVLPLLAALTCSAYLIMGTKVYNSHEKAPIKYYNTEFLFWGIFI